MASCDYAFRLDHVRGDPTSVDAVDAATPGDSQNLAACANATVYDSFSGPNLCPWGAPYISADGTIVASGVLTIMPGKSNGSGAGCSQLQGQQFGSGVTVKVLGILRGTTVNTSLRIHDVSGDYEIVANGDGQFAFKQGGSLIGMSQPFQSPMWWRIKPTSASLVAEYSSDGEIWMTLGTKQVTPPPSFSVELAAGLDQGTVTTGTRAVFDDLTLCP